jgi:hypothetical protein
LTNPGPRTRFDPRFRPDRLVLSRSLFNLQGTLPRASSVRNIRYYSSAMSNCQALFSEYPIFFSAPLTPLGDSFVRIPPPGSFVNTFILFIFRLFFACHKAGL